MHVLLIHQAYVGPDEPGGTRHYEFGKTLVQQGNAFTVVTSDTTYLTGRRVSSIGAPESHDGVKVIRARTRFSLHKSFAARLLAFFSFMLSSASAALRVRHVDIVMGTTPPLFQAVSAWFVARVKRKPLVIEVRDLWPEFAIDLGILKNPLLISLARWLEGFIYSAASHLVVNSPAYREYLIGKGVAIDRITLIPNGVDPSMFEAGPDGESFRSQLGLHDKFIVTYAGALGPANDIDTIIAAASLLHERRDIHFVLVGDGKARPALESQVRTAGLHNVTFAGTRGKQEMPAVLAGSDACVATLRNIPIFTTTYPNKVFDYMASGRPTVLAIDGVIRQVVNQAGGGLFVPPGDERALAHAVATLADNREQAAAMGRAAREYVRRHFNRADQAACFGALMSSLSGSAA